MNSLDQPTTAPQPTEVASDRRRFTIGVPAPDGAGERCFPLTPEAVQSLVERGFAVKIQEGGAAAIHYTDGRYMRCGAEVVSRREALGCDIVINLSPMRSGDVAQMRRGSMLLTLLRSQRYELAMVKALLDRGVIAVALDRVKDKHGKLPFADILAEIDGRAAIALASSMLANAETGKGILLGGIAGIVPCEVTILGSGLSAIAAARSALGLGGMVRMFDDDVYSLRGATKELGSAVVASALHRRVLEGALRTADVVVSTPMERPMKLDGEDVSLMKRGVLIFDTAGDGSSFPSLQSVDLAMPLAARKQRVCYVRPGNAVPRTTAMALSDTLITMLGRVMTCEGVTNALKLSPGLQAGVLTFLGRPVSAEFARMVGERQLDLSLLIQMS